MYVCMYVCMQSIRSCETIRTRSASSYSVWHTPKRRSMYIHHTYMHTYIHTYIHRVHTYILNKSTYMALSVNIMDEISETYNPIHVHIDACTHVHTYIHTFIHIYIHTGKQSKIRRGQSPVCRLPRIVSCQVRRSEKPD
jgi:hypothetical protein